MPRGRRRKIEVPTDTRPQFQLGDTAEDIERRTREREDRERREQAERERERGWNKRGKKGLSRQKILRKEGKSNLERTQIQIQNAHNTGRIQYIMTNSTRNSMTSSKTSRGKQGLWETVAATRNLSVKIVKKCFETQCTRFGKFTKTKSGQAAAKNTERQAWLKDSSSFL